MHIPVRQVVEELVGFLGLTTVAALAGVQETRVVQRWLDGTEPQKPHVLRFALQLVSMIARNDQPTLARAWFHGSNPHLGDDSPLQVFRNGSFPAAQGELMRAARAFSLGEDKSA